MKLTKNILEKFFKKKYKNIKLVVLILVFIFSLMLIFWILVFFLKKTIVKDIYAPKSSELIEGELKAEILFNNEAGLKNFSPEILNLVNQSQKSLDIAIYSMDSFELRDALYKAAERGVLIRLIVSYDKTSSFRELFRENNTIDIKELVIDKAEGFMHNKFIIADAQEETREIITGSFNPTVLQELYDPSFIFKTKDKTIIEVYHQEFERLFSGLSGRAKLNDTTYSAWQRDIRYQNGKVEIWLSPGLGQNNFKTRIMSLIYQAQESIDVMIWQITDYEIAKALIDKSKSGVKVRIITDDANAWSSVSKISSLILNSLINNNLIITDDAARTLDFLNEIYKDPRVDKNNFNSFFHHHTLIIDKKILVAGSGNWSYRANFSNDENAIVTDIPNLVNSYQESFDFNFNKLHKQEIDLSLNGDELKFNSLENFLNLKLVILKENSDLRPVSQICLESKILSKEVTISIPSECKDKALNIYILDSSGKVLANKLLGKILK